MMTFMQCSPRHPYQETALCAGVLPQIYQAIPLPALLEYELDMIMVRAFSILSLCAVLSACGSHDEATHDMADHADHDMEISTGPAVIAEGDGRILSISEEGDFMTLDHGPIEEISMGAMRMGFEVAEGVDLSDYTEGDDILFMISATENDIILTKACRPASDGPNCLE